MVESIRRSYREFVGIVADVLDSLNIDYGIAGSFASSQYGEPRQTLDVDLTLHLGFVERMRGSHHIFTRNGIPDILNLQPVESKAKPYQVKQVRNVILKHQLGGQDDSL